jgi:hypothetical protein
VKIEPFNFNGIVEQVSPYYFVIRKELWYPNIIQGFVAIFPGIFFIASMGFRGPIPKEKWCFRGAVLQKQFEVLKIIDITDAFGEAFILLTAIRILYLVIGPTPFPVYPV